MTTFRERMNENAKAGPEQRKVWHVKNQIKAAEIKGNTERAEELKAKLVELEKQVPKAKPKAKK